MSRARDLLDLMAGANDEYMQANKALHASQPDLRVRLARAADCANKAKILSEAVDEVVMFLIADASDRIHEAIDEEY